MRTSSCIILICMAVNSVALPTVNPNNVYKVQHGNIGELMLPWSVNPLLQRKESSRRFALEEVGPASLNKISVDASSSPNTANAKDKDDDYERDVGEIRTATGGFIYTLMVTLTVVAFLSNGAFLVYVFWLSK